MLLHVNEDFDDDLLQDAISMLCEIWWNQTIDSIDINSWWVDQNSNIIRVNSGLDLVFIFCVGAIFSPALFIDVIRSQSRINLINTFLHESRYNYSPDESGLHLLIPGGKKGSSPQLYRPHFLQSCQCLLFALRNPGDSHIFSWALNLSYIFCPEAKHSHFWLVDQ